MDQRTNGTPSIDFEQLWTLSQETYSSHPTSRHRRRFVLRALRRLPSVRHARIFDYGCGPGFLLQEIQREYRVPEENLSGCDLSPAAIAAARQAMPRGVFHEGGFPELADEFDVTITTEVIEHTTAYRDILQWLVTHTKRGGFLIVTTPGGTLDPPDAWYGHTQHFTTGQLNHILEQLGCEIIVSRYWGWPGFTLQKWVTRRNFDKVRENFMQGPLRPTTRLLFKMVYLAYMLHDLIPFGPQIFMVARKR